MPPQFTARAHRLLQAAKTLLDRQKAFTADPLFASLSIDPAGTDPLVPYHRETVAVMDSAVRLAQVFPDSPSVQLKLCDGLDGVLEIVKERLAVQERALAARRSDYGRIDRLAAVFAAMHQMRAAFTLRPHYDPGALEWLLAQARAKSRHGSLEGALLRDRGARAIGWFLYYLNSGVSKVLTVGGARGELPAVLEALFAHAGTRRAAALEGRLEPHLAAALKGQRCLLQNRGIATLLHARDPALLVPFLRGDALFTRLEGEWWTRFNGEPAANAARDTSRPTPSAAGTIKRGAAAT